MARDAATAGQIIQLAAAAQADALQVQDGSGNVLAAVDRTGAMKLSTLGDAVAPAGSIYFGSDHVDGSGRARLCRKDAEGNVTPIG